MPDKEQPKTYEEMNTFDGLECGPCADFRFQSVNSEEDFQALLASFKQKAHQKEEKEAH